MKNWRTTLAGLVTGLPFLIDALVQAYNSGAFNDKSGWQLFGSIAWIVITLILKDPKFLAASKKISADAQDEIIGDRPKNDGGR